MNGGFEALVLAFFTLRDHRQPFAGKPQPIGAHFLVGRPFRHLHAVIGLLPVFFVQWTHRTLSSSLKRLVFPLSSAQSILVAGTKFTDPCAGSPLTPKCSLSGGCHGL